MDKPFFSIIIPTLNEEFFLPRLLQDLSMQKEKDFEVIIVDAASFDGTKKAIENFKKNINVCIVEVTKQNVSFQRNWGSKRAKGDFLVFLDADNRIAPEFLKNVKREITNRKGLIFIPQIIPSEHNPQYTMLFQFINFLVDLSISMGKPFSTGGAMIWDRHFFNRCGGFGENLFMAEDHHIIQTAYQWGVRPKISSKIKVKFSLRRMKKEGQIKVFYKYSRALIHVIFKGAIKKKLFEYEMGGQIYNNLLLKKQLKNRSLQDVWRQIRKTFRTLLSEE